MRAALLAVVALALFSPSSGCMYLLCGPTDYYITAITASTRFENATWDADAAEAAVVAAGFEVASRTSNAVASRPQENVTMYASDEGNATRVALSFRLDARAIPHREVLDAERTAISMHEADAIARIAAYAEATNASFEAADIEWDAGVLHGDC